MRPHPDTPDCHICHHAYPALRLCSRCGPQCAACQQALEAAKYRFLAIYSVECIEDDGTRYWGLCHGLLPGVKGKAPTFDNAVEQAMRQWEHMPDGAG